jgi:predicted  nucleic acid-binding Zn-ribbon protein
MKRHTLLLVCLSMLLFACTGYEKDNQRLQEELKAVREENSYLKAEIVGLQKQLDEVSAKVKEERESLQRKFAEEREQMHKKIQEEREALQKKAQEAAKKKSGAGRKDQKDTPIPKTAKPV